jgi:hypothetical protein
MTPDIIARDREGRPVLIAEVEAVEVSGDDVQRLIGELKATSPEIPFVMVVDPEKMVIVPGHCEDPTACAVSFSTTDVLRHYAPDFAGKETPYGSQRVFHIWLTARVEAWLRDLAYHWKPGEPPKERELEEVGLRQLLEGGTTIDEELICDDRLR